MQLQNGFEIDGIINIPQMLLLNNEWTQVLIIETTVSVEQLRILFKDNNIVSLVSDDTITVYNTGGLIDIKTLEGKNYVWLYFISVTTNPSIVALNKSVQQTQIDLQKSQESITSISANVAEFIDYVLSNMPTS